MTPLAPKKVNLSPSPCKTLHWLLKGNQSQAQSAGINTNQVPDMRFDVSYPEMLRPFPSLILLQSVYLNQMKQFQVGEDSPVFPNLFVYCQASLTSILPYSIPLPHKV